MTSITPEPSKTQVRNAGRRLRDDLSGSAELPAGEQFAADITMLDGYRRSFATPLLKTRMGLHSFIKTCGYLDAQLAQRHKRLARILRKLVRYPNMNVTTMDDIAGCRLVLPDLQGVRTLQRHIHRTWADRNIRERDYITSPKDDGYRAVHLIVDRDGRSVEIQLRTERQHRWADTVENLSRIVGAELKWGDDPRRIQPFLTAYAEGLAALDRGEPLADSVREAVQTIQRILGRTDRV